MVVRFNKEASRKSHYLDANAEENAGKASEADKIVSDTKQDIAEGKTPAIGVSATNSGRGYDTASTEEFVPTVLQGTVEEEPSAISDDDSPELDPSGAVAATKAKATKEEGS